MSKYNPQLSFFHKSRSTLVFFTSQMKWNEKTNISYIPHCTRKCWLFWSRASARLETFHCVKPAVPRPQAHRVCARWWHPRMVKWPWRRSTRLRLSTSCKSWWSSIQSSWTPKSTAMRDSNCHVAMNKAEIYSPWNYYREFNRNESERGNRGVLLDLMGSFGPFSLHVSLPLGSH